MAGWNELSEINGVDDTTIVKINGVATSTIVEINGFSLTLEGGEDTWTYVSEADLTNGGADDQNAVTLASGLPSGITNFEIMLKDVSTDTASKALMIQLGDSGGFETGGYDCGVNNGANGQYTTTGVPSQRQMDVAAADIMTILYIFSRWDISEHIWYASMHSLEHTRDATIVAAGTKTLSGELTQVRAILIGGTPVFDGGSAIVRYM